MREINDDLASVEEESAAALEWQRDSLIQEIENIKKEIEAKKKELNESQTCCEKPNKVEYDVKNKIQEQKKWDKQMVTGKFMNLRAPGQSVKLAYIKYEDDPVKWYEFEHGNCYTIPRGFVDQINDYYHTPRFTQKTEYHVHSDKKGTNSVLHEVDTSNKRYAFVPITF